MTRASTSDRQFTYLDLNGEVVAGTVWCPGPVSRSVWVLPEGATRSAEAVVVRHPAGRHPGYHLNGRRAWPEGFTGWWQDWRITPGEWPCYSSEVAHETAHRTGLTPKDWRETVAADPTVGAQVELVIGDVA